MDIKGKATYAADALKLYWKTPPLGRSMPFKEIAAYSIGGIGASFITHIVSCMILCVGNGLIGNTIGIEPMQLYIIYAISTLLGIPLGGLRAKIIDSARNPKGKYRPYLLTMGLPTVILGIAFVWMPYENMSLILKCVTVFLFNVAFQFFFMFYGDAYGSLINVLSPNTLERSDVNSIGAIAYCLAPSIINFFMPLVARLITGQNTLYNLKIYRYAYPPLLIVGFLISLLIYCNTHEKIIQAKTHTVQLKFWDALRSVARNKYFWIMSLAGWMGFLELAFTNVMGWLYNYQNVCSAGQYSLIITIAANASLWAMVFAPFFIRAFGKRKLLIFTNILNIVFISAMLPVIRSGQNSMIMWLLMGCTFMNNFVSTMCWLVQTAINADIRDYQQYITGERIDGMFVAIGLIGSVLILGLSLVMPALYEQSGLNNTVLQQLSGWLTESGLVTDRPLNVYDVLYDRSYFISISTVLISASIVSATLNVIPFFFYDLTEIKQKSMVTVLKIRALFEDYGNNALSDEDLVGTIDIIEEAKVLDTQTPVKLSKKPIRLARRDKRRKFFALYTAKLTRRTDISNAEAQLALAKEKLKEIKTAYKNDKKTNEKITIAHYIMEEINKFETSEGQRDIERAQMFVDAGLDGLSKFTPLSIRRARTLPRKTHQQKLVREAAINQARNERYAKKTIAKYYPTGVKPFDAAVFDELFAEYDALDAELNELHRSHNSAAKSDRLPIANEIKEKKSRLLLLKKEIKKATNVHAVFNRAARPLLDAQKLLIQRENYCHYEEIKANYEESKRRAEQNLAEKLEREAREKQEKEAYAEKLKQEKAAAKAAKKDNKGSSQTTKKADKNISKADGKTDKSKSQSVRKTTKSEPKAAKKAAKSKVQPPKNGKPKKKE